MATPSLISHARVNRVSGAVVDAALRVHSLLGPGLLESAYKACLAHELRERGFRVDTEVGVPIVYDEEKLDIGYRIDLLVESLVVVEVKCVEAIHPVHEAQLLSYLRLSGRNAGLLINFYVPHLKAGIKRMVDGENWGQIEAANHGGHGGARSKPCSPPCSSVSSVVIYSSPIHHLRCREHRTTPVDSLCGLRAPP